MLGINGSVHWCLYMQIDKHSHIQSIRGSSSLKAVPHILLSLPSLLPSPSLSLSLSFSLYLRFDAKDLDVSLRVCHGTFPRQI